MRIGSTCEEDNQHPCVSSVPTTYPQGVLINFLMGNAGILGVLMLLLTVTWVCLTDADGSLLGYRISSRVKYDFSSRTGGCMTGKTSCTVLDLKRMRAR